MARVFDMKKELIYRISITIGVCAVFVFYNIFNTHSNIYLNSLVLIILVVITFSGMRYSALYMTVLILSLDYKFLIYISIIYMICVPIYLIFKFVYGSINKIELIYIATSAAGFAITLNTGGDFRYNIVKFLSLYAPIGVLIVLRRMGPLSIRYIYIYNVYFLAIIMSIISKELYFPNDRFSIFNGSENIAFFIITILMITCSMYAKNRLSLIFLLYIIYIISTKSRTAFVASFVIISFILLFRVNKKIFLCAVGLLSVVAIWVSGRVDILTQIRQQVEIFVNNVVDHGVLYSLSLIDIRGELYMEAIDLILESPLLGSGSIPPSEFDEGIYGIQAFHNIFLDFLVTFGVIGFLNYLVIFFLSLKRLYGVNRGAYTVILAALISIGIFQPILFNIQVFLVFFLMVALLEAGTHADKATTSGSARRIKAQPLLPDSPVQ